MEEIQIMQIKINTYKREGSKAVVDKEFVADTTNIFTSTIEDLLEVLDLDTLKTLDLNNINDSAGAIAAMVTKASKQVKPLIIDCFGMTEEDYRNTKIGDVIKAIIAIVKDAFADILSVNEVAEKN